MAIPLVPLTPVRMVVRVQILMGPVISAAAPVATLELTVAAVSQYSCNASLLWTLGSSMHTVSPKFSSNLIITMIGQLV